MTAPALWGTWCSSANSSSGVQIGSPADPGAIHAHQDYRTGLTSMNCNRTSLLYLMTSPGGFLGAVCPTVANEDACEHSAQVSSALARHHQHTLGCTHRGAKLQAHASSLGQPGKWIVACAPWPQAQRPQRYLSVRHCESRLCRAGSLALQATTHCTEEGRGDPRKEQLAPQLNRWQFRVQTLNSFCESVCAIPAFSHVPPPLQIFIMGRCGQMRRAASLLKRLSTAGEQTLPLWDVTGQSLSRRCLSTAVGLRRAAGVVEAGWQKVWQRGNPSPARDLAGSGLQTDAFNRIVMPFSLGATRSIALEALQPSDE